MSHPPDHQECFQAGHLDFVGEQSWAQLTNSLDPVANESARVPIKVKRPWRTPANKALHSSSHFVPRSLSAPLLTAPRPCVMPT